MAEHRPNESSPSDFRETAKRSRAANIADESAAYSGNEADEGTETPSSEKPVEGDEETAPRQPGSPG